MDNTVKYGILHTHSEYSIRDSSMKIPAMIERAKALGAPAIALTDHGILAGFYEFMKACKKAEIKGIPGMEAYYYPDEESDRTGRGTKRHLILMAKDMQGYHAICKASEKAYAHINYGFPRMNRENLKECFGVGSKGHGHVIATSACVNGVLADILLSNDSISHSVEKLIVKRNKYHPFDDAILDAKKLEEDYAEHIDQLISQRTALEEASKVKVTGMQKRLKSLDASSEEYMSLKRDIDETIAKKEKAKVDLQECKSQIAAWKKRKSELSKKNKPMFDSADKWLELDDEINRLIKSKTDEAVLYEETKNAAKEFVEIFGEGNFYVELQYHRIQREKEVMPKLAQIAEELGIPVVCANDAHYVTNSPEDIRARDIVAALRFNTPISEIEDEGHGELYIKGDDELREALTEILDPKIVDKAFEGVRDIVNACNVELEFKEHYPKFKGGVEGETTAQRLRRLALAGIPVKYPGDKWTPELENRLNYELDVIHQQGYDDYLCIVQDFLEYGRSLAKDCPEGVGYTIGPGRGSGVGSIVCYLTGITSVDPIKYNLIFERFLNKDRVSAPNHNWAFNVNPIAQGCVA